MARTLSQKQKKWIVGVGLLLFLILSALVCWYAGRPLIQFAKEPERFRAWVDSQGIWGPLLFLGMIVLQIVVAIIPGEPLEIAAGYAFGAVEGTLLCLLGAFAGRLAEYKTSRGAIQLPYGKPLPLDLIGEIATWCEANYTRVTPGSP